MDQPNTESIEPANGSSKRLLRFLLPSVLGAFFFLLPIKYEGGWTIPMGVLSDLLKVHVGEYMPALVLLIVVVSALLSIWFSLIKARPADAYTGIRRIFFVGHSWLALRLLGTLFTILIFFQIGPEIIWADATGHLVLYELATAIVTIFIFASLLLPLLTDFGLMEMIGTLFRGLFQKLFRLPGRSCIDAVASWMAAAAVGVMITAQQYDPGYYSGREAAVIATNFSVVSLPFCLLVAQFTGMGHLFVQYYLTVVVAGLVTAMILPRIPPLSRMQDSYSEAGRQISEELESGENLFRSGLRKAVEKADMAPGIKGYLKSTSEILFDIWFGLMPPFNGHCQLSV